MNATGWGPVLAIVLLYYFTTIVAVGTVLGLFIQLWEKRAKQLTSDTTSFTVPKAFFEESELKTTEKI